MNDDELHTARTRAQWVIVKLRCGETITLTDVIHVLSGDQRTWVLKRVTEEYPNARIELVKD